MSDLDRSRKFYESVFGFRVLVAGQRLIALRVKAGQVLLLCKKGASAQLRTMAHDGEGQLHVAFAIPDAALPGWEARLAQFGVAVVERRTWDAGGRSIYVRDLDGHLLELATPGVWANY